MEISFLILQIIKSWWWFFLPIILLTPAGYLYRWWSTWELWYKKIEWILIEIKTPAEVLKPFKAMEDIIHILWGVYDGHNWREQWCEGGIGNAPYWFSMEIVSIRGEIHFYMRILKDWRDTFESAIYAYYPEAEISVVEDYVKNVPQDIPDNDWDLYSEDYTLMKNHVFPFRTYSMFFETESEEKRVMEEKRMDPMNSFLEGLSKLRSGEQFWLQIVAAPVTNNDIPWVSEGLAMADKLAKRPEPKKPKPILQEAVEILVTGEQEQEREETGLQAPELRLTSGEREILQAIERKIAKQGFKTWIRAMYLYNKKGDYSISNRTLVRSYFNHFSTQNVNGLVFLGTTRVRIHYWFSKIRLYIRKKKQFKHYVERMPPYFPWNLFGKPVHPIDFGFYPRGPGGWSKGTYVLNAEELATIYHFPSKITVPSMPRVDSKRGGPPASLPIE